MEIYRNTNIEKKKWKLWVWGILLVVAGLGFVIPDQIATAFETIPIIINLGAILISFVVIVGASLSIRCPQCKLSFVWYALTHKSIGGWLSWLLEVKVCPQCKFSVQEEKSDFLGS